MKKIKEVNAVIYARTSSDISANDCHCITCQISECVEYCNMHSLNVVAGHFDVGSTAAIVRPGLEAIYELLLSGIVDALVVTSINRLFSNKTEVIELFKLLEQTGITLHITSGLGREEVDAAHETIFTKTAESESKKPSQKPKVIPKRSKKK